MSRSKKWKKEWSFFLAENGRRDYNRICKRCLKDCKQSYRCKIIACPTYEPKPSKNTPKKGGKSKKKPSLRGRNERA